MHLVRRVVAPRSPPEKAPMLVLPHGIGADEADLLPLAQLFDTRFLVISARGGRCTRTTSTLAPTQSPAFRLREIVKVS
jgi:predicted esterase